MGLFSKGLTEQAAEHGIYKHQPPPFWTGKGVQFYVKDSDGQWHYVNHANEWHACPPLDSDKTA